MPGSLIVDTFIKKKRKFSTAFFEFSNINQWHYLFSAIARCCPKTNIILTKGDTLKAVVTMIDSSGAVYTPAEHDYIRFAMKRNYSDLTTLVEKEIDHDTMLLHIEPEDTSSLAIGKYVYDIQITYANGDVDTFIDRASLTLTEEVE